MSELTQLDVWLLDLRTETEQKLKRLMSQSPTAPITLRVNGQLEMLEKIEYLVEELKE